MPVAYPRPMGQPARPRPRRVPGRQPHGHTQRAPGAASMAPATPGPCRQAPGTGWWRLGDPAGRYRYSLGAASGHRHPTWRAGPPPRWAVLPSGWVPGADQQRLAGTCMASWVTGPPPAGTRGLPARPGRGRGRARRLLGTLGRPMGLPARHTAGPWPCWLPPWAAVVGHGHAYRPPAAAGRRPGRWWPVGCPSRGYQQVQAGGLACWWPRLVAR